MKKLILVWLALLAINASAINISGGLPGLGAGGAYSLLSNNFATSATFTRPANTTAYAIGDVVGSATTINNTLAGIGSTTGAPFIVANAAIRIDINAIPSGMGTFRLHLYDSAPTAIADNVAFNIPSGDRAKYIGYVEISTITDMGDTLYVNSENINLFRKLATGSTTIYAMLQTLTAFTPSSADVYTVYLYGTL
jgi:hypothetical protein